MYSRHNLVETTLGSGYTTVDGRRFAAVREKAYVKSDFLVTLLKLTNELYIFPSLPVYI